MRTAYMNLLLISALSFGCESAVSRNVVAPEGARRPVGYLQHSRPPAGYSTANAWLQIATLSQSGGPGIAEIDYMRLYARVGGRDVQLSADEYNGTGGCGATAARHTWGTEEREPLPASYSGMSMMVEPGQQPTRVFHPWICRYPREPIPPGADRVWMEVRARITGVVAVQGGIDYWRTPTAGPNLEAGATDWYLAQEGWQTITLAQP
jgi:hypothetical protein